MEGAEPTASCVDLDSTRFHSSGKVVPTCCNLNSSVQVRCALWISAREMCVGGRSVYSFLVVGFIVAAVEGFFAEMNETGGRMLRFSVTVVLYK